MKGILFGWVIAGGLYFGFNLVLLGLLIADALRTSARESGLTVRHAMLALFAGLPLYAGAMFLVWGLPMAFPDKFQVGGERLEDGRTRWRSPKLLLTVWNWKKK